MTLGSKIKRKLNSIGSKIQDGYNRMGGKKALLGGALSILGASAAGILSHSLNEFINKPLEAAAQSQHVADALDDAFDGGVYGLGPNKLVHPGDFPSVPSTTPSLASLQARYRTFGPTQSLNTSAVPKPPVYTLPYIR
jgi:hypothetical protein